MYGNKFIFREPTRLDGTVIIGHSALQFSVRAKFRSDRKILKCIPCALWHRMMTSSNGNIFTLLANVRGIQRWQSGIYRWPVTSNVFLMFLVCAWKKNGEQTAEMLLIWDTIAFIMTSCSNGMWCDTVPQVVEFPPPPPPGKLRPVYLTWSC